MRKKVIFMLINMNVGGTEKALLNMISEMPRGKFDITILLLEKVGGFLDSIPSHVRVEYLHEYANIKDIINHSPKRIVFKFFKEGNWSKALFLFLLYLFTKITKERSALFRYVLNDCNFAEFEYDIAVAYAGPMDFISYFVIKKIKSKRKIQWIHFDITKIVFNKKFASTFYKKFDEIFVVSNEGKRKLIRSLPSLGKKINTFGNVISESSITKMSNEGIGFLDNFNGKRILTVGRLSKEKGQDIAISVLALLKQNGFNVRWYCVGEGEARKEYKKLIKDKGLEEDFILLGSSLNPYPYMKECDIYVQTSRHEGFCITLAEAKVLKKPIITTNFTGAEEQIIHQKTGIIVNANELEIYNQLERLLESSKELERLSINLAKEMRSKARRIINL